MRRLGYPLRWCVTLAAGATLLLGVAIANGGPILYPDSIAYLIDGERIAHAVAPYAVRPVFYGIPIWFFRWGDQFWPALFLQALIVAHAVWLLLRCMGAVRSPRTYLLVVLALVVFTPVTWHIAHLLPDIFVAVLILALFLLGFCADRLGPRERVYLVLLAAAATSFHLTALPIGFALVVGAALWRWRTGGLARPVLMMLPLALAVAGSLAFNMLVWQRLTLAPNSPPSLLARILADGPGVDYLRSVCPQADYELCHDLDRFPLTEDAFIWGLLPAIPVADGKRIKAEAGAVIRGTVTAFPAAVLGHMLLNAGRQAVTFRSETQVAPGEWAEIQTGNSLLAQATRNTLQARRFWERPRLDAVNALHAAVVAASLVAAIVLLRRRGCNDGRAAALLFTVLLALIVNAIVTATFGGVFGRYEGRVIWLLPLAVVAVWLSRAPAAPWPGGIGSRTGSTPR